jgi:hypothetical protein
MLTFIILGYSILSCIILPNVVFKYFKLFHLKLF